MLLFAKRICIVLLISAFIVCAACAGESVQSEAAETGGNTTPAGTETTGYFDGVEGGFEDYNFNILWYDADSWDIYLAPEAYNGETLNDAAYTRNKEVEDLLGIVITDQPDADSENTFRKLVLAGDGNTADMICFWSPGERSSLLSFNYIYNWKDIPYIRLDRDWYNQTANAAFSIAGKQFFAVSDLTFTVQQHFRIVFNKDLMKNLNLEYPYDSVISGGWTLDLLGKYCADSYVDLNSDGKRGLEDQFGIVLNAAFSTAFMFNFGEIQVKSGPGGFEINLYSEGIANKLQSAMDFALSDGAYLNTAGGNPQYKIFDDGNALFKPYGSDPNLLRLHEFDIGYIPYPKYDEAQPDYVVWSAGGLMAVPICAEDIERTGAVIEALSAASNKYLKDAFIETYVENKILRDAESQQVYRMMRDKATYDLSYNIDPSGKLSDYKYYSYFFTKKNADIASYYASVGQQIKDKYAELYDTIYNR